MKWIRDVLTDIVLLLIVGGICSIPVCFVLYCVFGESEIIIKASVLIGMCLGSWLITLVRGE